MDDEEEFRALKILNDVFPDPDKAYAIALEYTCFPMSCEEAQWQAARVIAEYKRSGEIKYLPEWNM